MTKGKGRNPGASSLDKHIRRTVHKERSQPTARKHLGPLEKHKDHVVRARRRKTKVQRLLQLKRAAAQRNPDEFHIGMTQTVLDMASGHMRRRPNQGEDRQATMQRTLQHNTRNVHYLQHKANADLSVARELLQETAAAALTAAAPRNKHIVFVENDAEFRSFNANTYFDATPAMLRQHPALRGRLSVLKETVLPDDVLLTGSRVLSTAQRRRERREMQTKLQRTGFTSPTERAEWVAREKEKRDMKKYRFVDAIVQAAVGGDGGVEEVCTTNPYANNNKNNNTHNSDSAADGEEEEEEEEAKDEVQRVMELRREKAQNEARTAARRAKEIQQRVERSKSLQSLAKSIKRQNEGLKKNMQQKKDSRFKPNAMRRAR